MPAFEMGQIISSVAPVIGDEYVQSAAWQILHWRRPNFPLSTTTNAPVQFHNIARVSSASSALKQLAPQVASMPSAPTEMY